MMCDLVCVREPCFCVGDDVYSPAEDTWLAWRLVESLPYLGGLGADVGCGSCALLNVISEKVEVALGIDLNPCAAKACKLCSREALVCDSATCLRKPLRLAVANLPYLPCDDDLVTCDRFAPRVLEGLRVEEGGYLVLVYSSLTSFDPLSSLKGFEVVKREEVSLGFETLIGVILIKSGR